MSIGSESVSNSENHIHINAPRWKMATRAKGELSILKKFPTSAKTGTKCSVCGKELDPPEAEKLTPEELEEFNKIELGESQFRYVPFCGANFVWDDTQENSRKDK